MCPPLLPPAKTPKVATKHVRHPPCKFPTAGAAVGVGFSEKESSPYTTSPPQRRSYLSNTDIMSTHSYQGVPPSEASMMTGATGRPAEMPDNRGFGYAPYELYDESGMIMIKISGMRCILERTSEGRDDVYAWTAMGGVQNRRALSV